MTGDYRNGQGRSFDTLRELMDEHWQSLPRRERVWITLVERPFNRHVRNPVRDAELAVRFAWQRVFRGWDDRSMWALDSSLSKTLGAQLVKMAEIAHGHPGGSGDPWTFETWTAALRLHGEALLAYYAADDISVSYQDKFDKFYPPAQEALRWVADNLGALWD